MLGIVKKGWMNHFKKMEVLRVVIVSKFEEGIERHK